MDVPLPKLPNSVPITNDVQAFLRSRRSLLAQHAWVLLALTAVALAAFVGVAYGNTYGGDDFGHLYRTCETHSPEIVGRSLALSIVYLVCPYFGAAPLPYHLTLLGLRALSAFLLYVLVRQVSPDQPLFAFACGAASATVLVHDSFFIFTLLQQTDHILSVLLTLLTLNVFVAYLRSQAVWRYRTILLALSLILVWMTPLVRESVFPLLFVIPWLLFFADRDWSWPRWIGLTAWSGVIFLGALRFVTVLTQPGDYSSGTFADLNIGRMLSASQNQFDFAFRIVSQLSAADLYPFRLAVFISLAVLIVCFFAVQRVMTLPQRAGLTRWMPLHFLGWIIVGIAATWLGFASFLPTKFAGSPIRTHVLSIAGEAVTLVSIVWLISSFTAKPHWKTMVQLGGLAWVIAHGAVFASLTQQEMNSYAGTWADTAYFLRSLANEVPALKEPTLFIYVENPATQQTPFAAGADFQYSLRYLYENQATGITPTDTNYGQWRTSDAGIWYQETWIDSPHTFGWDAIIFITRDTSGRIYILDTLPAQFQTAYRQGLYQPRALILKSFIPNRVQQAFPILAGPDWSRDDAVALH